MRRGEYFPIYRPSQLGGKRTKPFTRPAHDSLPHHECAVKGCGKAEQGTQPLPYRLEHRRIITTGAAWTSFLDSYVYFCSLGCLGRWAALQEIRS